MTDDSACISNTAFTLPFIFAAGIASHVCYFIIGERNKEAGQILVWFFSGLALSLLLARLWCWPLSAAVIATLLLGGTFISGLGASITIYRLLLHGTRKYPGRMSEALTKWTSAGVAHRTQRYHAHLRKLHQKYGDVVRTGPQEISVNNVEAIKPIYGRDSFCLKGPWYDLGGTGHNLHRTRDPHLHARQRPLWEHAFKGME